MKKKSKEVESLRNPSPPLEFNLHRILVPIDFSEHSKNALAYAITLAKQFHSELHLVYVVETAIYPAEFGFGQVALPGPAIEKEFLDRGKKELDKLVQSEIRSQVKSRITVAEGKPAYEILSIARNEHTDLIVIATHGHTGVEHLIFGSTTEKVVRKAPCPVLVVRATASM